MFWLYIGFFVWMVVLLWMLERRDRLTSERIEEHLQREDWRRL